MHLKNNETIFKVAGYRRHKTAERYDASRYSAYKITCKHLISDNLESF